MYYSEEIVEEVRQRNDIVDVISSYVHIKKKGSTYVGLCPFHNEKTGSFHVSQNKQIFKCFGCGAGGNVFTFVMDYENYTFVEALKNLADRAGIKLPEAEYDENTKRQMGRRARLLELNKDAANYFYVQLRANQGAVGMEYFKKRELSDETMKKFALGFANVTNNDLILYLRSKGYTDQEIRDAGLTNYSEKYGMSDKFWNRVMFPIQDINHRVIGFGGRVIGDGEPKYLNSPETEIFDKSRNLYGLNHARTSRKDHLILCEGYMDVIAMHQAGFTEAVASLGTAFTSGQASLIRRYTENVILAYDSDGAGTKAALRAIEILRDVGLTGKILHLEPYKDPDEFIKALGPEAFEERLKTAEDSFSFELRHMEQGFDLAVPESKIKFRKTLIEKIYGMAEQFEDVKPFIEVVCDKYHFGYDEMVKSVASYGNKQEMKVEIVKKQREDNLQNAVKKDKPELLGQKILLSWLVDEPELYSIVKKHLSADDFDEGVYHQAACKLFEVLEQGQVPNPSAIMTSLQAGSDITEEEQSEISAMFCTKMSDRLNQIRGVSNISIDDGHEDFESNTEKAAALKDILVSIKKSSLSRCQKNPKGGSEGFKQIIEKKNDLECLQKTQIVIP